MRPHPPSTFVLRACHDSHHERTPFPENILCVEWEIIHSTRQKNIGMGVTDLAVACGSEPVVGGVCTAVVGSARNSRVLDAGSAREDRSSKECYVGDTREYFCAKDDDSILHTHHLCHTTREPLIC